MILKSHFKTFVGVFAIGTILLGCNSQLKKDVVETFEDGTPKIESFYTLSGERKEVIKQIQYYENGQKKYIGHFKNEKKDGMWIFWYENGEKWNEGYYLEGLRTGEATVYHENGKIYYKGTYNEGRKIGTWEFYNEEGQKVNEVLFENGKIIKQSNKKNSITE